MARGGDVAFRTKVTVAMEFIVTHAVAMEFIVTHAVAMETSNPVSYMGIQERFIVLG